MNIDLDLLALKRLRLIGVTFRTRSFDERIAIIAQRCAADIFPAMADRRLHPVIDRTFPLEDALEAQGYMASNAQVGKIVLTLRILRNQIEGRVQLTDCRGDGPSP